MYIVNKQLFNNNKTYPVPEYWDKVKHILEPTYGAIVYQEQTMLLFKDIGGYTLGEADSLRKVKSLEPERSRFVNNAVNKCGFTSKEANELFDRFSLDYSFNRSHAAAYGKNSAICAYFIKYYPVEFFSAALSLELTKQEPNVEGFIKYCRKLGLVILPPDINKSTNEFIPNGNYILMPLCSVDKIGDSVIEEILTKRPFESLDNMLLKVEKKKINKAKVKMLIKSGCFDFYNKNRSELLSEYVSSIKDDEKVYFWCDEVQMSYEKQSYGFYLNKHPLDGHINLDIKEMKEDNIIINCIINEIKYSKDKNGNTMCFLKCSNKVCSFSAIIFSSVYNRNNIKSILRENCSYKMYGTVSRDSVIVSNINII